MSNSQQSDVPAADQHAAATALRDTLGALLEAFPGPAPELSDEELITEILQVAKFEEDAESTEAGPDSAGATSSES